MVQYLWVVVDVVTHREPGLPCGTCRHKPEEYSVHLRGVYRDRAEVPSAEDANAPRPHTQRVVLWVPVGELTDVLLKEVAG